MASATLPRPLTTLQKPEYGESQTVSSRLCHSRPRVAFSVSADTFVRHVLCFQEALDFNCQVFCQHLNRLNGRNGCQQCWARMPIGLTV